MPASADPMHYGHKAVMDEGERILGEPVTLVVVRNPFKPAGLFSHEERIQIARLYLPEPRVILSATDDDTIRRALHESKRIVRGWRSEETEVEDEAIMLRYGLTDWRSKVVYIHKGDPSSASLKELVAGGKFEEACLISLPEVVEMVRRKLAEAVVIG
ncbi:hypothetical protein KJ951_03585 [Patescibacteria group bacterium]|nr:hypothetical protein [Patescibacteria group bacterium]MBU1703460.1 hypothetical protein [Patescibacteria group bacterium]MBU1953458.1 hypothetical protein [Patescibacteria group bacterium]